MAKKKILSVEDKLRSLYRLQLIDSRIDEIKSIRGELPLQIEDLKNEIKGLNTRLEKLNKEISNLEIEITNKKTEIADAQELSKKYKEQQKNIRNNREYESLSKEIEYQDLEIQFAEKKIKEFQADIEYKKETVEQTSEIIEKQNLHLEHKDKELKEILKETENEEAKMIEISKKLSETIDDNLLRSYHRIRNKVKNGLAIVSIERGATSGSFFAIPPQVQIEIAMRKKINIDEYSGCILVDAVLAEEERLAFEKKIKNI